MVITQERRQRNRANGKRRGGRCARGEVEVDHPSLGVARVEHDHVGRAKSNAIGRGRVTDDEHAHTPVAGEGDQLHGIVRTAPGQKIRRAVGRIEILVAQRALKNARIETPHSAGVGKRVRDRNAVLAHHRQRHGGNEAPHRVGGDLRVVAESVFDSLVKRLDTIHSALDDRMAAALRELVIGEDRMHLPRMSEHQLRDAREQPVAHVEAISAAVAVNDLLQHDMMVARAAEAGGGDGGLQVNRVAVQIAGDQQSPASRKPHAGMGAHRRTRQRRSGGGKEFSKRRCVGSPVVHGE